MGIAKEISMDILVPVEYNILFIPLQDSVYVFTYNPSIIFSKYWIKGLSRTILNYLELLELSRTI